MTRFVRAGAVKIFVGPRLGLRGPRRNVQPLIYHDDHMHVRIGPDPKRRVRIGRSVPAAQRSPPSGQATRGARRARSWSAASTATSAPGPRSLASWPARRQALDLWVVSQLNPDGFALGRRQNGRGVDLNRNFPSEWRAGGRPWDPSTPGRVRSPSRSRGPLRALIRRISPRSRSGSISRRRSSERGARACRGAPLRTPCGDEVPAHPLAARHRPELAEPPLPGNSSFVVELPAGPLTPAAANRHARAVLTLLGSST